MGLHDKKYTNDLKNLFSIFGIMQRTEEGTMLKVLFYLYTIHPGHATKSYIAKAGRFAPNSVGRHIDLAYSRGFLSKTKRHHKFGNAYVGHDSYFINQKGIKYIHEELDRLELKTVD